MSTNSLQKYKEGFFSRIFKKLQNLFNKNKEKQENKDTMINNVPTEGSFKNNIKVSQGLDNNYHEKKKLISMLNDNPELLENYSNEQLEKILKIYLEDNEEKRRVLKKLTT